jgi:hypothetical protein
MSYEQTDNQKSVQQPVPAQQLRALGPQLNPVDVSDEPTSTSNVAASAMPSPPAAAAAAAAAASTMRITSLQQIPGHPNIMALLSSYHNFVKEHEVLPESSHCQGQQQQQHQQGLTTSSKLPPQQQHHTSKQQQQHTSQARPLSSSNSQDDSQQLQGDEEGGAAAGARSARSSAGKKKKKKMHSSTRARVRLADLTNQQQVSFAVNFTTACLPVAA